MRVPPGSQKVFDQFMATVFDPGLNGHFATVYSDPRFNDWLGRPGDLRLFVVADQISGPVVLLGVKVQETGDEETAWVDATPGLYNVREDNPPAGVTIVKAGSDTEVSRGRPGLGIRRIKVHISGDGAASARVRVWVSGHGGYRKFHRLLLSERIEGAEIPVYAPHEACAWMAGVDKIAIAGFAEKVSGTTPELELQVDESPNGRAWSFVSETTYQLFSGGPYGLNVGSVPGPSSGFLRFTARLDGLDNPAATVRLWVTGRDDRPG